MKTRALLKNFKNPSGRDRIIRNLNRICDIRILDMDVHSGTITIWHTSTTILERIKRDLNAIGYQVLSFKTLENSTKRESTYLVN